MRDLILGSKVEERRKRRDGDDDLAGERRRRSDRIAKRANRER